MKARAALDSAYREILKYAATSLKSAGFDLKGRTLRKVNDGNVGIIEFQKSDSSSAERIIFTVNVGVICGLLLDIERVTLMKAESMDAHVRKRLGRLMQENEDKWWELTASTNLSFLTKEITENLISVAVPFIEKYLKTQALLDLWKSGESPGLTDGQRNRCLVELERQLREQAG